MTTPPPPLTSVQLMLVRHKGIAAAHVVTAISDFLDYALSSIWSLRHACEAKLLSMLPRLAARLQSASVDPYCWKYQCDQGLVYAVKHDNLAMVEWLHECCPSVLPYKAMIEAARAGNLRLLEWLSNRHERAPFIPQMMDAAAAKGQLEMLQYLHNHPKNAGCNIPKALGSAVRSDLIDVKWFTGQYGDRAKASYRDAADAIHCNRTEVTKFCLTVMSIKRICLCLLRSRLLLGKETSRWFIGFLLKQRHVLLSAAPVA